jgi:hypothetical protein
MNMIEIHWHPTRKELRVFSLLLIVFCGVVAIAIHFRTAATSVAYLVAGIGFLLGTIGAIWPSAARPVYRIWMVATFPIGWTVTHLILAMVYYLVFTPLGLLLRMTGHDPLKRVLKRSQETYWEPRPDDRRPTDYLRPF